MSIATLVKETGDKPKKEYPDLEPWQIERNYDNFGKAVEANFRWIDNSLRAMSYIMGVKGHDLDDVIGDFWVSRSKYKLRGYKRIIPNGFRFGDPQYSSAQGRLMKYLLTCLYNEAKNHYRRVYRRQREQNENQVFDRHEPGSSTDYDSNWTLAELASEERPPDNNQIVNENLSMIERCFNNLTAKQQEIIVLAHYQRYSYDQMQQVLKIPIGTVKSRLNYANVALGREFENQGVLDELKEAFHNHQI